MDSLSMLGCLLLWCASAAIVAGFALLAAANVRAARCTAHAVTLVALTALWANWTFPPVPYWPEKARAFPETIPALYPKP